jgi:integrase
MVPFNLAFRLESIALQQPEILYIQGVRFVSYYFIPGGPFFSQWFGPWARTVTKTKMSFHSLRHSFAQQRLFKLAQLGFDHVTAMTIVSQEMGHFRPEITTTYMKLK